MNMIETVRAVKSGKMKLADVRPGIRKQVQALIPAVGAEPQPVARFSMGRGAMLRKVKSS